MDSGAPPSKEEVTQGIDTRTDAQKDKQETSTKDVKPTPLTVPQEIKQNLTLINRAVHNLEPRFTARVLRTLTGLRKKVYREALQEVVNDVYPKSSKSPAQLLPLISLLPTESSKLAASSSSITKGTQAMEIDETSKTTTTTTAGDSKAATKSTGEVLPESDVYVRLLLILGLIDVKEVEKAFDLAKETTTYIQSLNRRSMDHLAAKVWFYLARCAELLKRDEEVRSLLLAAHSTASLRNDEDVQATLLNALLRNYFNSGAYDQADKLLSKTSFPESAGNPQLARYLFYLGRIRAIQLNYTEAHTHLQHAIRRAPSETVAPGFMQTVYKYFVVVELLMGDIPERSVFRRPVLRKALSPYFQLVQAVRIGDLEAFQNVLTTHASKFASDGTHSLIVRLRHNVIKTALRMISLAYSRISLKDVCLKLHLDSEEDTEYIVAKAIRDGVIDAEVDHAQGWMKSREGGNVYETDEPQKAFQQRIEFCMNLHNESVKAMRYLLNANKPVGEDSELARERKLDIEAALAEAAEDDDMDM
ncbi:hypothetical protein FFLO_00590 [Filobasidium floriforme]|uniref:PCI domain-containing protein n=1 Tax=Filobasidium floriforme TaxID=5210 RepID=A0A8K0NTK6_9TREE|nr:hypothetical protein FFLO_00590 [Filobasidium floriforme]